MSDKTVKIYDFKTRKSIEIPAAELAPGYVRAQVEGVEGTVFVKADPAALGGEIHHYDFSEVLPRLKDIYDKLKAVYPITWKQWLEGFQRDANPEREIAFWSVLAKKYASLTKGKPLPLDVRQEYFQITLSALNNGPAHALEVLELKRVSKTQAKRIVAFVTEPFAGESE